MGALILHATLPCAVQMKRWCATSAQHVQLERPMQQVTMHLALILHATLPCAVQIKGWCATSAQHVHLERPMQQVTMHLALILHARHATCTWTSTKTMAPGTSTSASDGE